ncbi:MAG: hypothetical protein ABI881_10765 [Betaproteobacteria bacterium]
MYSFPPQVRGPTKRVARKLSRHIQAWANNEAVESTQGEGHPAVPPFSFPTLKDAVTDKAELALIYGLMGVAVVGVIYMGYRMFLFFVE